jgi:peptide deformylase
LEVYNGYTGHIKRARLQAEKNSRSITDFNAHIHTLLDDMIEVLKQAHGVGLAAPQVGALRKAVIIDIGDDVDEEGNVVKRTI